VSMCGGTLDYDRALKDNYGQWGETVALTDAEIKKITDGVTAQLKKLIPDLVWNAEHIPAAKVDEYGVPRPQADIDANPTYQADNTVNLILEEQRKARGEILIAIKAMTDAMTDYPQLAKALITEFFIRNTQ